jgi:pimeloyl-ACP methyl ester carboxylesterase
LSLRYLDDRLHGLVLWNPVLDLRHTFLDPQLPWGVGNFGPAARQRLGREDFLLVDGEFELGGVLFEEMEHYRPAEPFLASPAPALIVHGDRDTCVSYDIAKAAAGARPACEFHTIVGGGHGFDSRDAEDEAIAVTVTWLTQRHASRA